VQELIDQAAREGVPKRELEEAASIVASVLGRDRSAMSAGAKSAADFIHTWSYLALLSKATLSSLAEATTFAIRTGNLADALSPLVMAYRGITRSERGKQLHEAAITMGVNGNRAVEEVLMNRLGGDHNMDPKWGKLLNRFFSATLLTQLTRAQRAHGVGVATGYLKTLAKQVKGGNPGDAPAMLNELGIADHEAFADWILEQGAVPNTRELFDQNGRPTLIGNDYMVAVRRFVDQTIQNPGREHRPQWSVSPMGRLASGIMSFSYAFYANVIKREVAIMRRSGIATRRTAAVVGGAVALAMAQTIISTLREVLFNADRLEDKEDEEIAKEMMALGLSRTFGLGSADPLIQYMTGLKYSRSLAETAVGAGPGLLFGAIDQAANLLTEKNSVNTDTAEYRAAQAGYRAFVTPVVNAMLSRVPLIGGAAIVAHSDKRVTNAVAGLVGRKPEQRSHIDDLYQKATADLDAVLDEVNEQIGLLPESQWAAELDRLKSDYPGLLDGVTLDTYVNNDDNRRKRRVGRVKKDGKGRPQLKLQQGEQGSVLGELEGYPEWRRVGGKNKQFTTEGVQDRIRALNRAINALTSSESVTLGKLATYGAESDAVLPIIEQIGGSDPESMNSPVAQREASKAQINRVLDDLRRIRREEKRLAVELIEKANQGEPIPRGSGLRN
jgi:hypothetical protein